MLTTARAAAARAVQVVGDEIGAVAGGAAATATVAASAKIGGVGTVAGAALAPTVAAAAEGVVAKVTDAVTGAILNTSMSPQPENVRIKLKALPNTVDKFVDVVAAAGLANGNRIGSDLTIRMPLPGEFYLGGSKQVIVQRGDEFLIISPPSGDNGMALVALHNKDPKSKCRLEVFILPEGTDRIDGFRLGDTRAEWLILGKSKDVFESSLKDARDRGLMHSELSTIESMLQDATKILKV